MELKLVRVEIIVWTMKKGDSSSHREILMLRLSAVLSTASQAHARQMEMEARVK